jgi:hypothetical protein
MTPRWRHRPRPRHHLRGRGHRVRLGDRRQVLQAVQILRRRIDARLALAALQAAIRGRDPPPDCVRVLEELFQPVMHQKLFESVEALQTELDAWL